MLIIFNLWAIPVGIVIVLLGLGIGSIFPALRDTYPTYMAGALMIIVGGISDRLGAKARVFFMPIWLIGIGLIGLEIGPVGWIGLSILAVVGIVFLSRWSRKVTAEAWEKTSRDFTQSPTPPTGKERDFWQWTKTVLFVDALAKYTPEICEHNLKVLQAIKQAKPQLNQPEATVLALLEKFLVDAKNLPNPPSLGFKLAAPVVKMIDLRLKAAKEDAPFRSRLPEPPLVTA